MAVSTSTSKKLPVIRKSVRFRFPCGHLEPGTTVDARLRVSEHAAWVHCRACNVVALAMQRTLRRGPRRG